MPPCAQVVSRLLGSLYEAAACPERWPHFLEEMKTVAAADKVYFLLVDPDSQCNLSVQSGFYESAVISYENYFAQRDVVLQGYAAHVRAHGDWVGNTDSLISHEAFRRSELFNDFSRPNGDAYYCGAGFGNAAKLVEGGLGLSRSEAKGEFGSEAVGLLAILAPHLKRAFGLHRAFTQLRVQNAEMRATIESLEIALITLDGEGRVIRLTRSAEKLVLSCDGLKLHNRSLAARTSQENIQLRSLITGAAATGSGNGANRSTHVDYARAPQATPRLWSPSSGGAMLVSRRPPKRPLRVFVAPFHSSEILLEERPAAIIFISDPDAAPASRANILRSLYGLTPREASVADLLMCGIDVEHIAERLKVGEYTIRFYLKCIFRKTGTTRQSDLAKLILGIPGG